MLTQFYLEGKRKNVALLSNNQTIIFFWVINTKVFYAKMSNIELKWLKP